MKILVSINDYFIILYAVRQSICFSGNTNNNTAVIIKEQHSPETLFVHQQSY